MKRNTEIYTLKHWQLMDTGNGIVLEGHLHGRRGYPDGIRICTSSIITWEWKQDALLFETQNSYYLCSPQECILESDTFFLLNDGTMDDCFLRIEESRLNRYGDLAGLYPEDAVILNWYGCDYPYLKWVVWLQGDSRRIEEQTLYDSRISAELSLGRGHRLSVRPAYVPASDFHIPGLSYDTCHVYVENSGNQNISVSLQGTDTPVLIAPGEIRAA